MSWSAPTNLVKGKVYTALCIIEIGTGGTFRTPNSFTITIAQSMKEIGDLIDIPLSQVKVLVRDELKIQSDFIGQKMDEQQSYIQQKMDEQTAIIGTKMIEMAVLLSDVEVTTHKLETATEEMEITAARESGTLILPGNIGMGEELLVRYRLKPGLHPLLDVYNNDGEAVISGVPLEESKEMPGLYIASFKVDRKDFKGGKPMTVMVSEETTGNLEVHSVVAETTSLTQLQGLISGQKSSITGSLTAFKEETITAIKGIEMAITGGQNVAKALAELKLTVEEIPAKTATLVTEAGVPEEISELLNGISERVVSLAGQEGYDIKTIVSKALTESPTLNDIQNKTNNIKSIVELIQSIIEQQFAGKEEPFVFTLFER